MLGQRWEERWVGGRGLSRRAGVGCVVLVVTLVVMWELSMTDGISQELSNRGKTVISRTGKSKEDTEPQLAHVQPGGPEATTGKEKRAEPLEDTKESRLYGMGIGTPGDEEGALKWAAGEGGESGGGAAGLAWTEPIPHWDAFIDGVEYNRRPVVCYVPPSQERCLPGAVIAGFAKCGTAQLLSDLGHCHPQIVAATGEPRGLFRKHRDYLELLPKVLPSDQQVLVESTPVYARSSLAELRKASRMLPGLKVGFISSAALWSPR